MQLLSLSLGMSVLLMVLDHGFLERLGIGIVEEIYIEGHLYMCKVRNVSTLVINFLVRQEDMQGLPLAGVPADIARLACTPITYAEGQQKL